VRIDKSFPRSARTSHLVPALVLALAVAGTALASSSSSFSGKTKQKLKVTFKATPSQVSKFQVTVSAWCVSLSASVPSGLDLRSLAVVKSTPIKSGRFTINYTGPLSTHATIKGKISGHSASGSVDVRYAKSMGIDPATGSFVSGSCAAKTTWTAKSG
jgi:hypothetical protein